MKSFAIATLAIIAAPSFALESFEAFEQSPNPTNSVYSATATYYSPAQGGGGICGGEGGYCGAPSDGS